MGKVTIACLGISTAILLITFGQGMTALRSGAVAPHLAWAMATLVSVLAANVLAIFHAAQSDRVIRALRQHIERNEMSKSEPDATPGSPQ